MLSSLNSMNEQIDGNEQNQSVPTDEEVAADNLRRYVELAIEIERSTAAAPNLTISKPGGSVSEGLVDPSTLKNTG